MGVFEAYAGDRMKLKSHSQTSTSAHQGTLERASGGTCPAAGTRPEMRSARLLCNEQRPERRAPGTTSVGITPITTTFVIVENVKFSC